MLRSFSLMLFLGTTIIVQCVEETPEVSYSQTCPEPSISTFLVKDETETSSVLTGEAASSATAASLTSTQPLPACVQSKCNCRDFSTQKEAQEVLEAFPHDPHGLDRNKNGVACESLPD